MRSVTYINLVETYNQKQKAIFLTWKENSGPDNTSHIDILEKKVSRLYLVPIVF